MNVQVVIPMSGFGERFRAKGYTVPKPLIRVAGAPMIEHVLDMYPTSVDVVFIVNEDHLKNDDFRMGEILTSLRPQAKIVPIASHKSGPSGAVALARDAINPVTPTIVNYCDFTSLWDFDGFIELLSRCDGVVATYTGFHPHMARSTKFACDWRWQPSLGDSGETAIYVSSDERKSLMRYLRVFKRGLDARRNRQAD